MENNNDKTMDRRSFLRGTTLASTGAALGAITLAGQASASGLTVKPQTDLEYDQVASAEVKVSASLSEAEIAKLPRVKQKMVAPPFAPEHDQVAKGGPKVVEVTLTVEEMPWKLDDEAETIALTFNGSVPGPLIVVHEGDYVEVTMENPETSAMEHNVDFHAATGALGGGGLTHVLPGETAILRWKATKPGAFVYHCAPGGSMIPYHVIKGMNGAVVVLPRDGLTDGHGNPITYDKMYYIGEQDFYVPKDENGNYMKFSEAGEDFSEVMEVARGLIPTHEVFNGKVGALTGEGAMTAKVGEKVLFIHSQANRDCRPHLIGGHWNFSWEAGSFSDVPGRGHETAIIRGGSAGAFHYEFEQPGVYAYVNHNLIEATELGAVAHMVVEGEWNDDLMKQIKKGDESA
ncbi:copper-containing nitrite reductase [Kiloniella sp.]|uniref:copper-containing nitrite reductase n=1 Tax=Kiloniella sp. TaxID=1938587 RepID=UPI003A9509D8